MITSAQGWKAVGALLSVLIVLILAVAGWAWSSQDKRLHNIESRDDQFSDRLSRLEAHYEHIEVTQQEIKGDIKRVLEKLDRP